MRSADTREIVTRFIREVRSGGRREAARELMADAVVAHQLTSERDEAISRSPEDYVGHVDHFKECWGDFELSIDELLVDGDKAYVRWTQVGRHLGSFDGEAPTGARLREIASAVYRVVDGRIAEYWIQIDRHGLARQLQTLGAGAGTSENVS